MFKRAVRRPARRSRSLLLLAGVALLLLAACGGGSGGGGGGTPTAKLHALIVNAGEADAAVTYTGADGVPAEQSVPTCSAQVLEFPLSDPFTISVDETVVVDSGQLPEALPGGGETDLVVRVTIARDGTTTFDSVRAGRSISIPARSAYCPTLPG